jgi:membrane protein implicated in regulation of membrane protease activity
MYTYSVAGEKDWFLLIGSTAAEPIAVAVAAMVVRRYMKKREKEEKRNRQKDVNLWYYQNALVPLSS